MPDGRKVTGERVYRYLAFLTSEIEGTNTVVYDRDEATFISWGNYCTINNCSFFGVDQTRSFLDTGSGNDIRMSQTSVYLCYIGFGGNGVFKNCRLIECHFSGNSIGIASLLDSHVFMCEVNSNSNAGIRMSTGINSTIYIDNKVEFNNGDGFQIYGVTKANQILGGLIDRNGGAGISMSGLCEITITGVRLTRNGRLSEENLEKNAHIALLGSVTGVKIIGISMSSGSNDSGGDPGYSSPISAITASNGVSVIESITGSVLNGVENSVFTERFGGSLKIGTFTGNDVSGIEFGSSVNILNAAGNKGYTAPGESVEVILLSNISGGAQNAVFSGLKEVANYTRALYEISIVTRKQSTGATGIQRFMLAASREEGGASAVLLEVSSFGVTPVVAAAFNTTGETLTITLDPESNTLTSTVSVTKVS